MDTTLPSADDFPERGLTIQYSTYGVRSLVVLVRDRRDESSDRNNSGVCDKG